MTWHPGMPANFRGEVAKIRWEVVPYTRGPLARSGLDLGCGPWKLWPDSIGIDAGKGSAANLAGDVADLAIIASESQDYVFSSHTLEDIEDYQAALTEWWRVLKPGGHLVLYLPHAGLYPRRGQPSANPAHQHDFLPADITAAMIDVAPHWRQREEQVRGFADEYSFLQVYQKGETQGQTIELEESDPDRRCIVVRHGGYGDVLVAGSTFPHLKAEGWHLTVVASVKGAAVLRDDPNIDRLITLDPLDLRPGELAQMWAYLRTRCAKFVNFSETFEGLLLADPRRASFWWPHAMREHYMGGNYLEAAHRVADVPHQYQQKFFETQDEWRRAKQWRADALNEGDRLIVVAATGSGVNKIWPGLFEYVGRMVKRYPQVHVAVLGGLYGAELLEHERIHSIGESWPVRDALTLGLQADLVVGQETGIMNAVAHEGMPKIVLLSHSSAANLTQYWENTRTVSGDVPCYPCHRLHADWSGCNQDPVTKFAACQSAIEPMTVVRLSEELLGLRQPVAA